MHVDVVISTRNNDSEKHFSLSYVIRALLSQPDCDLNIIVADNGSEDETVVRLRSTFGQKVGILDTSDAAGNLSASRNAAAACGTNDLILFLDDDMVIGRSGDLRRAIVVGQTVDFACGAIRYWSPPSWHRLIRWDDPVNKFISTLVHTATEPLSINRISGKNIIDNRSYLANFGTVKRSPFEAVGGFDEAYAGWGYQDTDLMYRLCLDGYTYDLFSAHGIVVYHLSHTVNKGPGYEVNRHRFLDKQLRDGRMFNTNHFFEIYENDGYSLFSDFEESRTV